MKRFAMLCGLLLALPISLAENPASKIVEVKAPEAIKLVAKETGDAKADPKKTPLTVLDVRTAEEFSGGHIAGAVNLDFKSPQFKDGLAKLDKSKTYLVHCASGRRSAQTRDLMKSLGFTSIYHLEGGMKAWEKAGGPVVKTNQP